MTKQILLHFYLFVLMSCAGVSTLNRSDLYSQSFLDQINSAKATYASGDQAKALADLKAINPESLRPSEDAMRRNLMGVVYFSMEKWEQAVVNFDTARSKASVDQRLKEQIGINLVGTYFKLNAFDKAYEIFDQIDEVQLGEKDLFKYHSLGHRLGKNLGRPYLASLHVLHLASLKKSVKLLKDDPIYPLALSSLEGLSDSERIRLLSSRALLDSKVGPYFLVKEAERMYFEGKRSEAAKILSNYADSFKADDINEAAVTILNRLNNTGKVIPVHIGVILPLSGRKKKFGLRALDGIDTAFKEVNKGRDQKFKIFFKDSQGSSALGHELVEELVQKEHVSIVIGGLFSEEALRQYQQAKRMGAIFISLSPVYLSKDEKDHLLVEIPGSVESQIAQIGQKRFIEAFGKKLAVLFPEGKRGKAYMNELWRQSISAGLEVTNAISYKREETDFRSAVKSLLGLGNTSSRSEEFDIYDEIYGLENIRSTRRVQTLGPIRDFDWVFVPAFPRQALQIIPSFSYFDAFNTMFVGGPSWRSRSLGQESFKLGALNFIDDEVSRVRPEVISTFLSEHRRAPKVLELRAYDSMNIAGRIMSEGNPEDRSELDGLARSLRTLKGETGTWSLEERVWIKDMRPSQLRRGKIRAVDLEAIIEKNRVGEK